MHAKDIDQDVLQQIIDLAEESMIRPFQKKKQMLMEDDVEEEEEGSEEEVSEDEEGSKGKSDMSEEDLAELLEEYSKKGR